MGEEVFRLAATGLLAVIAVQLIVAVALLGRINRKLESPRPASAEAPTEPDESDAAESEDTPTSSAEADPPVETAPPGADVADGEGPYEKDGRWWYRQDDELLVYDDRTEQWVVPELHPLEEARGWDTASVEPASPAPTAVSPAAVEPTPPLEDATPEPASTTPISTPEPVADEAPAPVAAEQTTPEPAAAAPIPEPVDPPAPIAAEEEDSPQMAAHWKCPACGVINGSTATSCRMCFAARP